VEQTQALAQAVAVQIKAEGAAAAKEMSTESEKRCSDKINASEKHLA
jgi:hypothetical protein